MPVLVLGLGLGLGLVLVLGARLGLGVAGAIEHASASGDLSSAGRAGASVYPPRTLSRVPLSLLFLVAASVALVCQGAVVYAVLAGRTPASSSRPGARWAEIAWVILPTLVLLAVLAATWLRVVQPVAVAPVPGIPA